MRQVKTLVIGGTGFIGQYLLPILAKSGRQVTVLGRKSASMCEMPANMQYVEGDFGNQTLITSLLDVNDEVVHLAYATVPNTSYENPLGDLLENLPGTVQLFSEIASRGLKLLLVSSGGTIYGEAEQLPINESHATKPISPYGLTKLTIENYARLYSVIKGLKFICVRPSNAYGVGQKPFTGQGFVSTAIASIMMGKPVTIFGEQGTVRDYVYVSDIASGIFAALEHGQLNETYNIGSGVGLSNLELMLRVKPMLEAIGCKVIVQHMPAREFDVKQNVLDSTKLTEHTGWLPAVDLDAGLTMTLGWLKALNG
jgi:UDP-glucose 4-epimerase